MNNTQNEKLVFQRKEIQIFSKKEHYCCYGQGLQ